MKTTVYLLPVLSACLLVVGFSRDACGYIDPGTGSYILQILIAGIVGSLFVIKIFWKRIAIFLAGIVGSLFVVKIFWKRIAMFLSGLFSSRKAHNDSQ